MLAAVMAEESKRSGSRSFSAFVRQAWPIIDPTPLSWNWHMDAICSHLEAVAKGEIKRIVINTPPRIGKSTLFSILWPAWIWIDHPEEQFLFLSYSSSLSVEHSVKCRQVIESPWYQAQYRPRWQLRSDQNQKSDFANTIGGRRRATSISGGIVGHGGTIIAIDDPLNSQDAYSKAAREDAKRVISQAVTTRLNDIRTGKVAMIMQRIHEDDPTQLLLDTGDYEHLMLPAEYEPGRRAITHRVIDGNKQEFFQDPRKESGDLIFPERFPAEFMAGVRSALGAQRYAGQYQQRPAPLGGGMFQRAWWRFWKPDGVGEQHRRPSGCYDGPARPMPVFDQLVIGVDANFRAKAGADPVAIHVWGGYKADRFLLDRVHGPFGFTRTVQAIREICKRYPKVGRKLIERAANGEAIIETLQSEISGIIPVEPLGGKETRAWAIQPQVESGNVYLPDGAPWIADFIDEFDSFPAGRHDDDVDCTSMCLSDMASMTGKYLAAMQRVAHGDVRMPR